MISELTKAEEQIMQVIWDLDKCFVKDIIEQLPKPKPAYNTVSTIVRILETKGFVDHKAYGKTHEYFPLVSKEKYRKQIMSTMMDNYFDGSVKKLVSFFVNEKKVSLKEMDSILKNLDQLNKKQ